MTTTQVVVYEKPLSTHEWLLKQFGVRAKMGIYDELAIRENAAFIANHAFPNSPEFKEELATQLFYHAVTSITRWYRPDTGCLPRTYADRVMKSLASRLRAEILKQAEMELAILDCPIDSSDPLSPSKVDMTRDDHQVLSRCLEPVDFEMLVEALTPQQLDIFEARLHNISREKIRRELGLTPGVWKRIWRTFQHRAAFILDLVRK